MNKKGQNNKIIIRTKQKNHIKNKTKDFSN
jgi:hypothetical protein